MTEPVQDPPVPVDRAEDAAPEPAEIDERTGQPLVAEAPGEQAARDQALQAEERALAEQRGGVSATHNESGPAPVTPDSGDRNWVTSPVGQQPVLARDAVQEQTEPPDTMPEPDPAVVVPDPEPEPHGAAEGTANASSEPLIVTGVAETPEQVAAREAGQA